MSKLDPPEIRASLMTRINETVANIELAEKRVQETKTRCDKAVRDARSQVGTAEAELRRLRNDYEDLVARLLTNLPGEIVARARLELDRYRDQAKKEATDGQS